MIPNSNDDNNATPVDIQIKPHLWTMTFEM